MPRRSRKLAHSGVYHVMLRGINKQNIFEDEEDNETFLWCLNEVKKVSEFELYAYCLMGNHVHLLLKTGKEPIAQIFRRLGSRFVYRYNRKYQRCGTLFGDRFRSEPVEDDAYFATVLTYIYQNPVKAGLCEKSEEYEWSSRRLLGKKNNLIDEKPLFDIIPLESIIDREQTLIKDSILEPRYETRKYLTDTGVRREIAASCGAESISAFESITRSIQSEVVKRLQALGASFRQLSRLTGMSCGKLTKLAAI